jgi:hypothetical protein
MTEIQKTLKSDKSKSAILLILYFVGIVHWLLFFFLLYPEGDDRTLYKILANLGQGFGYRAFNVQDWFHDLAYIGVIKEALCDYTIPFHVPDLNLMYSNAQENRFLGATVYISSPQIILLYWVSSSTFVIINHLIMYTVGFYGCILLKRHYYLGNLAFLFLFILLNFNGYFVEKIPAYGAWESGEFLFPYVVLLILWAGELKPIDQRNQLRLGIWLGIFLAWILHLGTPNNYLHWMTFVVIWGLVNYKLWKFSLTAVFVSFSVAFFRLILMVLTFGHGVHRVDAAGYNNQESLVQALVGTHTALTPVAWSWWELSLYVSLPGLFLLVYFGMFVPFMKFEWRKFRGWSPILVPCAVFLIISIRRFKYFIIPKWLPFFNGEGFTSRYMIVPLIVISVISAVNMQGFINKYWNQKRARCFLVFSMILLSFFMINHSRVWRMHKVQWEYDSWQIQNADEIYTNGLTTKEFYDEHHKIILHIDNNPEDIIYFALCGVGLLGTCMSLTFCFWWLWYDWRKHRKIIEIVNE